MDFYMPPGMNGGEAAKKIKDKTKDSFIACLTSQTEGDFSFNKGLKHFDA